MMFERLAKSRSREPSSRHSVPLEILVVDDDPATRLSLAYALSDAGHHVTEACDGEEALAASSEHTFDVALLDVRLPKVDGLTIFRRLRLRAPTTAVILMTAFATVPDAVASLREGAYDYVTKPFDPEELTLRVIGHIAEHVALKRELEEARRLVASRDAGSPIVGHTPAMVRLVERMNTIAQSDAPVLVSGETGTGKELVAHTLHARSRRKGAPFVVFDCSAFPTGAVDAELFGEERATLTTSTRARRDGRFRAADGGTLLLGEVSALPLPTQAKLLMSIEEGVIQPVGGSVPVAVDVRVVSTTAVDLEGLVARGAFRDDLFQSLKVLDLSLPPLRDRRGDMPLLVAHFLRRFCPGRVPPGIGPRAWEALMEYSFPGNVRELAHAIERAVVLARGGEIDLRHLPDEIRGREIELGEGEIQPLEVASRAFERQHVARALRRAEADLDRAAALLGVSRERLLERMDHLGVARGSAPPEEGSSRERTAAPDEAPPDPSEGAPPEGRSPP